jgi:NAD(P)-dependent dehydrogenase (short-subunit alcohol dehydrogenase family)
MTAHVAANFGQSVPQIRVLWAQGAGFAVKVVGFVVMAQTQMAKPRITQNLRMLGDQGTRLPVDLQGGCMVALGRQSQKLGTQSVQTLVEFGDVFGRAGLDGHETARQNTKHTERIPLAYLAEPIRKAKKSSQVFHAMPGVNWATLNSAKALHSERSGASMAPMQKHLYILTGGSRGMGLAIARQLLQADHALICISRHTNADLATAAQAAKTDLSQWALDLSDGSRASERLGLWLAEQDPAHWRSATLINNAGTIPEITPLSHAKPLDLAQALRVGLEAPMQLSARFLGATEHWPLPRKVLNISSGLGRRAMASQAAYCAAKAGMDHFTRCMALDEALKPHGAKVCSLAPGVIDTDMQVQLRSANSQAFPDQATFVQLQAQGLLTTPEVAAGQVLAYLNRADFGHNPIGDVRD